MNAFMPPLLIYVKIGYLEPTRTFFGTGAHATAVGLRTARKEQRTAAFIGMNYEGSQTVAAMFAQAAIPGLRTSREKLNGQG